MAKASIEEMLNRTANYLVTYLKQGVRLESFTAKIDGTLNINDMKRLLRIHFLLKEEVINFVRQLPERVRRIRTTVEKHPEKVKGEIRGKIHWQSTVKARCTEEPGNPAAFIQNLIEREYNTPENMVLRELLSILYSIAFTDLKPAFEGKYLWLKEWLERDERIRKTVKETFLRNIYIRRITSGTGADSRNEITERMLVRTVRSRNPLYREAAHLLLSYRKLMNYRLDDKEAIELLTNTFIHTDRAELLFELYWTFRVIEAITGGREKKEELRLYPIDGTNNLVAEWEDGEHLWRIYHDSTGDLNFRETIPAINSISKEFFKREVSVLKKTEELGESWFGICRENLLWDGRPDIMVERYERGKKNESPAEIFIGEVKYTEDRDYALQGLRELLEYMAFVKGKGDWDYFEGDRESVFTSKRIHGWLFVEREIPVKQEKLSIGSISVVAFPGDTFTSL